MQAFVVQNSTGKVKRKGMPGEKGAKAGVKTEGLKENHKKTSQRKKCETKGYKKNGVNRKPCQENMISREENVKRRRSQEKEMPKARDAKKKGRQGMRLTRHLCQEAVMTLEQQCQERRVCQVLGFRELSTRRAVKIQRCQEQAGSRESGSTRQGC